MTMIKDSFDDALKYVQKIPDLSVGKCPGWIPYQQSKWCSACDKLLYASGNVTWYHKEFIPFKVIYKQETHTCEVTHIHTGEIIKVAL